LPGLSDLAANSLSANPMPRGIWAYHSVGLIPIITAAAICGVERITSWQKKFSAQELTGLILTASLVSGYFFLPLPLIGAFNIWAPNNFLNWPDPAVQKVRSAVGRNASLSVQANVGAHFSQRQGIYMYPNKTAEVDGIVLRLASPTTNINNFPGPVKEHRKGQPTWLDGHLQMDRAEYLASIECLLTKQEYGILLWDDPWLILSRETKDRLPGVEQKISQLRGEWRIEFDQYQDALKNCLAS
jgi:hypothetical protein